MDEELTAEDCELIVESLDRAIQAFERYQWYPDEAFRRQRVDAVKAARRKVQMLRCRLRTQ